MKYINTDETNSCTSFTKTDMLNTKTEDLLEQHERDGRLFGAANLFGTKNGDLTQEFLY